MAAIMTPRSTMIEDRIFFEAKAALTRIEYSIESSWLPIQKKKSELSKETNLVHAALSF
jgi:hypothetical protein